MNKKVKEEVEEVEIDDKVKIRFMPGCFDNFEGTQEELDEFVKEIQKVFESMTPEELEEQAVEIDIEEIVEAMENDPEAVELMKQIAMDERKLH